MKYRLTEKRDINGPYWFTENYSNALGQWAIVLDTLSYDRAEADAAFDLCVAASKPKTGITVREVDTEKRKEKPLVTITRTLEIDCIVRYRVEPGIDDELPNVYDITIEVAPGELATRHPSVLKCLEKELPVEEQEKLDAEFRRLDEARREGPEYSPEDAADRREAREARLERAAQ